MKLRIFLATALMLSLTFAKATIHNVSVGNFFFNPSTLTIDAGDTVKWTNTKGTHNVNGSTGTFTSNPASFSNGVAASGTWTYQFQFTTAGTYLYQCDPHSGSMTGTITVNAAPVSVTSDLILTGVVDGPLTGGLPKAVELYATTAISDLSLYGVSRVSGSNGSINKAAYVMPADVAVQGQHIYITNDSTGFFTFFGFSADYVDTNTSFNGISGNGDDAYELYKGNTVVDVFGDATKSGTGEPWEYLDSWAYRVNGTGPDGNTFVLANWTFGTPNALDNETSNATAVTPFTIGTYGISTSTVADLRFTEIMYNNPGTDTLEFFEVYNNGTVSVDLTGYYLSEGVVFTFPNVNLAANAHITVCVDSAALFDVYGVSAYQWTSGALSNSGEDLVLKDSTGATIDSVEYDDAGSWDTDADGNGYSLTLCDFTLDQNLGASWLKSATQVISGTLYGSPSAVDASCSIVLPPVGAIPTYSIASLTTVNATTGLADSLNVEAKINGIVYTDDFEGGAGYSFYMYDNTGGINVFNFADVGTFAVTRGDSIRVIGTVEQYNGLTEMVIDSVVVLSQSNTLKTPTVITDLDETNEGEYVRLNGFSLVTPSQWPASGSSATVDISNGTVTVAMRIDDDTNIGGSTAPTGSFDIIGAGSQYDSSSPYDTGYQIFPRDLNDIISVVPTTPTINFPVATQAQSENAGTVSISLPIAPSSANAETVKIYVSNGTGITTGDYSTTPATVTDTITLTVAANAGTVSFDVTVIDDMLQESSESITLTLVSSSAGLSIGSINTHVFIIQDNDTPIPTYDIADIDGTDALGEMDSAGVYCKIVATVTSPQLSSTRTDFFITNATNTAGIKISQSTLITYSALVGDQIRVVGTLSQFNGGIQISADSLTVISSGNPILPTVQSASATIGEAEEGRVLRYNSVELVDSTGWPSANFGNFDIVLANGDTAILRLDSDIPTLWGPTPIGTFDVIGVAGQYDASSPYTEGYQIQPRVSTEIIVVLPKLVVSEIMPSSNLSGAIGGDWFELTNYGTTPINLNGFSWDDDSRTAGTHTLASLITLTIGAGESVIFYDGLASDAVLWSQEWSQQGNNIVIYAADYGLIGFSGLSSSGDEVNFYDEKGQLVSRASYTSAAVTAGVSIEFDTTSTLVGPSVAGVNGAYVSANGDVGSPSNKMPISITEFLLNNMELYPNPTSDLVKLTSTTNAKKEVKITDLKGSVLREISTTETNVEINVSNLPKGVYLIQVTIDEASATHKLIVQ